MKHVLRVVSHWGLLLHIYVSMASFIVVFFFAVTGITLNHAERFGGAEHLAQKSGAVNPAWVKAGAADVEKPAIVAYLKGTERLSGATRNLGRIGR